MYVRSLSEQRGFSLVEVLVGTAVFLIVAVAVYNGYIAINKASSLSRYKLTAAALANEQLEIARNMPYSEVGIQGSIPSGVIPHVQTLSRDGTDFAVTTTVRNVDDPFDGTLGGTPNDTSPADYKLVEVDIDCASCKNFVPVSFATRVAPKNLEMASTNGALFIRVFDGNGQPIAGAAVHVVNQSATPTITIDDVTDASGQLALVDVPPASNAYEITVSKAGYTTERTYPLGDPGNPNPIHQHATVVLQQVTQTSFSIDRLSTMNVTTVTPTCTPIGGIGFTYRGSKLLGTSPDVYKTSIAVSTNSSGQLIDSALEWDTYTFSMSTSTYVLLGMNPVNPITIAPAAAQNVQMIVNPKTPQSVLVSVVDAGTGLPLSDATVEMTGPNNFQEVQQTGKGYLRQTDWSGGSGQETFSDDMKYSSSDGNIETAAPAGELRLAYRLGQFEAAGYLTSSTFDVGSSTNFHELVWSPSDEPIAAGAGSVKFQVAANNDAATWNFTGPDGSTTTYYTIGNRTLAPSLDGNRYFRYRAFLTTADQSVTPNVSDVAFTFTTQCTPPGQVVFDKLGPGTYTITVTHAGYQQSSITHNVSNSWSSAIIQMTP